VTCRRISVFLQKAHVHTCTCHVYFGKPHRYGSYDLFLLESTGYAAGPV